MEKDRDTLVLYTTAICNLNCKYCYIDKNKALIHIDEILDESFKGDYYFNFTKEMFPKIGQLRTIETWGGEPFLRMDRVYETLHKIINYYPFFDTMFSSTNFSFPEWIDQFFGLMSQFGQYPERDFNYSLQLSLDGPEYITDYGRGKGTTKKCLENFNKMIDMVGTHLPSNVNLSMHFKPTLDINSVKMLDSKEKIIEYYQFFESLVEKVWNLNYSNVTITLPIPNTACPSPTTKEDGIIFANLCRMCCEIEQEKDKYFKYYDNVTPFRTYDTNKELRYEYPYHTCGSGINVVGLLPYHLISTCHNGFVDLISDYKKMVTANNSQSTLDFKTFLNNLPARLTLNYEKYALFEKQMSYYTNFNTTARLANIVSLINVLALSGQIDEKYKNTQEALKAGVFIQSHTAYCLRDNYNTTGSCTLVPVGLLKLLLNGAKEYIEIGEDIIENI